MRVVGLMLLLSVGGALGCRDPDPPPRNATPSDVGSESPPQDDKATRKRACVTQLLARVPESAHGMVRPLCAEWIDLEVPGISVAIVEPGQTPIHLELGVRCLDATDLIDADTRFRIGSVTKPITAALALGLVEEQRLTLDSRAGESIPHFDPPPGLEDPRLADLLAHRSGLTEIEPDVLVRLRGDWLAALHESPDAGAAVLGEFNYSNAGYCLVGAMIEAASDSSYAELVETRIAEDLGLSTISARSSDEHSACGHLSTPTGLAPVRVSRDLDFMPGDPQWMVPAGGVLASTTDLARFGLEIGAESLPGTTVMLDAEVQGHGMGLRASPLTNGTRVFAHSGDNAAFHTELMIVPSRRAIAISSNRSVQLPATMAAARELLARPANAPAPH